MADNFNFRDFAIGLGAGWLSAFILYQLRDVIGDARQGLRSRMQEAQTYATLSAEGRYISEFTREAQASHLAGEQIQLARIAIEPRFWPPSRFAEPPDDDIRRDVFRVVPKIPDLPFLAQPYNVDVATIDDLYNGPGTYALLGAPGSGRTTTLQLLGLIALGIVSFPAPEDKVSQRLKAEEDLLDPAKKAERLKYRLTIEDAAFERLAQEKADSGLRGEKRRQADLELRPYRDMFPLYVHLADVRPSAFKGRVDPAEPLVRGLQAQVGAWTAKALPHRLYPRLEQGGILLMLDGYDDLAPDHQREIAEWLPELLAQYGGGKNHIIVTGPAHGYAPLVQAGFAPLIMRPWSDIDIQMAADKWAEAWPDYVAGRKRRLRMGGKKPDHQQLNSAVASARGLTPAEVTLKIMAAYRGEFARTPGAWIENYLTNLNMPPVARQIATQAASVQLDHHEITAAHLIETGVVPGGKAASAGKALVDLFKRGLLVEVGRGEFQFRHRAIGDYLAAVSLSDADDTTLVKRGADVAWAGALAFAAGMRQVDLAAAARLDPFPDVLLTGLTTLARWLSYLDGKPAWRANLLRLIGNQFVQPGQYPYARERLAAALAGSRDPEAAGIFERALKSPDPDVRRLSALALGVLQHSAAAEPLGAMVKDVDNHVALAAAAALGAIGTDAAFEQLARAFAFGDENVRQIAAETLADLPDVGYETLYDATRHENMDYRRAAVFGLRRMKPGWALIEIYRVFLEDEQWYVRSAAQEAIIDFQTHTTANSLSSYPALARIEWLKSFARAQGIKGENAAPEALARMVTTPDPRMQPVAVQALGQLGMLNRAGALYRALLDAQPAVRDMAHRSLAEIGLQYNQILPSPV